MPMREAANPSTLELLAWTSRGPRTYADAMEAWRSSCPRLSAWEDALADGLIQIVRNGGASAASVTLTASGRALLEAIPPR